eukprot:jgi/Bigna1/90777/estExt_fgenesh1_pg.C_790031
MRVISSWRADSDQNLKEALMAPGTLWNEDDDIGSKNEVTLERTRENTIKKMSVFGSVKLEDVLSNRLDEPLDRRSFGKFCKTLYCEDQLEFVLTIMLFKETRPTGILYRETVTSIETTAAAVVAAAVAWQRRQLEDIKRALEEGKDDTDVFDDTYKEIFNLLKWNVFHKFEQQTVLYKCVVDARSAMLWCCNRKQTPNCTKFFSVPEPTNVVHYRLYRLVASILGSIALVLYYMDKMHRMAYFCLFANFLGLLLRSICGFVSNKARRWGEAMSCVWTAATIVGVWLKCDPLVYALGGSQTLTGYVHSFSDDKQPEIEVDVVIVAAAAVAGGHRQTNIYDYMFPPMSQNYCSFRETVVCCSVLESSSTPIPKSSIGDERKGSYHEAHDGEHKSSFSWQRENRFIKISLGGA